MMWWHVICLGVMEVSQNLNLTWHQKTKPFVPTENTIHYMYIYIFIIVAKCLFHTFINI